MNEFILINLNQTINRALLVEAKRERSRWAIFSVILILFLGIGFGFYRLYSDLTLLAQNRENRIQQVKDEIESLKENVGIDLSKSDIETYYEFENKHILWADKLKVLSEITPDYMAITEIDFKKDKNDIRRDRVTLSAISRIVSDEKDFSVVEKFINLLKSNEVFSADFSDIRFVTSDRFISRGQEILAFKIEASRTKFERRRVAQAKKGI